MIVIDLTHPWNVLESLERWTQVVSKHVNSLKISEKQRRRMEDKSEHHNNSCFYVSVVEGPIWHLNPLKYLYSHF